MVKCESINSLENPEPVTITEQTPKMTKPADVVKSFLSSHFYFVKRLISFIYFILLIYKKEGDKDARLRELEFKLEREKEETAAASKKEKKKKLF